jgi:hypothetical protein
LLKFVAGLSAPLRAITQIATLFTTVAIAALGLGVDVHAVPGSGVRVTAAVILSFFLLGIMSYAPIRVMGIPRSPLRIGEKRRRRSPASYLAARLGEPAMSPPAIPTSAKGDDYRHFQHILRTLAQPNDQIFYDSDRLCLHRLTEDAT